MLLFFVLRFDISPPFGTWWVPIRKKKNGDDHIAVGKRTEAPSEELGTRRRSFCHLFSAVVNFFIVVRYFPFGFVWFPRRNAPLLIKGKWHHLLKWHLLQFNGLYPFQPLWLVFHLLVVPSFMDFDNSFFFQIVSPNQKNNICSAGIPFHLLSHTSQNTSCFNKPCFFLIEVILRIKFYRISPYGYRVPYRTRMTSALRCSIAHRMKVHLLFSSSRFFSPNFTSIIFTKIF